MEIDYPLYAIASKETTDKERIQKLLALLQFAHYSKVHLRTCAKPAPYEAIHRELHELNRNIRTESHLRLVIHEDTIISFGIVLQKAALKTTACDEEFPKYQHLAECAVKNGLKLMTEAPTQYGVISIDAIQTEVDAVYLNDVGQLLIEQEGSIYLLKKWVETKYQHS